MAVYEGFGFISVDNKKNLNELGRSMTEVGLRIISLGVTASELKKDRPNLDIIHPEEFIGGKHLQQILTGLRGQAEDEAEAKIVERECREIVAGFVVQHMSQPPERLKRQGRGVIRAVGINLIPPQLIYDDSGKLVQHQQDKSGELYLRGAQEGLRLTFTNPNQYPQTRSLDNMLRAQFTAPIISGLALEYSLETSRYLEQYQLEFDNRTNFAGLRAG